MLHSQAEALIRDMTVTTYILLKFQ